MVIWENQLRLLQGFDKTNQPTNIVQLVAVHLLLPMISPSRVATDLGAAEVCRCKLVDCESHCMVITSLLLPL